MEKNDYSLPRTPPRLQFVKHNNLILDIRIDVHHQNINCIKYFYGITYHFFINSKKIAQTQILTNVGFIKPKRLQHYEIRAYENINDLWQNIQNERNYNHFANILEKCLCNEPNKFDELKEFIK